MDPRKNPYAPGAGTKPPALVGRERTTDLELRYLYAMAELGPAAHRASEVARRVDRSTEQAGPIRSRLIGKGLLFTPGHGYAAFTVPQFEAACVKLCAAWSC